MDHTALDSALRLRNPQYNRLFKFDSPIGADWLLPLYVKGRRDWAAITNSSSTPFRGEAIRSI
ncbi:hypothetical protein PWP93_25640 [Paraburkholderia sp. A1RI-2L]|uniref:hypothetical protein n=1 Tax=Paraburkholderia sp. A1RI-2L TaxID=3028367 RepID=UPI003B7C3CF2